MPGFMMSRSRRRRIEAMERYYGSSGTDPTTSSDGSGSGSWMEPSIQRMSFGSPAPNAFLGPAFNACMLSSQPGSPLSVDASLLRYTRPSRHLLSSSSSSSSDSRDLASPTTRSEILHMLHLRSSVTSSSTSGPSRSLLSPIDNLQAPPERSPPPPYTTPVKVEMDEDVLVMDGVLVMKSGSTRTKPSSEFGGSEPSSSSSSSVNSHYKTDFCHSWEEYGFCRHGSKCQFAHGKEDIRGVRPLKQAAKPEIGKSVQAAGWCVNGARLRHPPHAAAAQGGATRCAAGTSTTVRRSSAAAPPGGASAFVWPPSEAEDKMIDDVLYGPSRRTRLPVFVEICSGLMDGP